MQNVAIDYEGVPLANVNNQLDVEPGNPHAEYAAVRNGVPPAQSDKKIYYVHAVAGQPPLLDGFGWTPGLNAPDAAVETWDVDSNPNQPALHPVAEVLFFTAHEAGHLLGIDDVANPNRLMTGNVANNPGFSFKLVKAEWDALNP